MNRLILTILLVVSCIQPVRANTVGVRVPVKMEMPGDTEYELTLEGVSEGAPMPEPGGKVQKLHYNIESQGQLPELAFDRPGLYEYRITGTGSKNGKNWELQAYSLEIWVMNDPAMPGGLRPQVNIYRENDRGRGKTELRWQDPAENGDPNMLIQTGQNQTPVYVLAAAGLGCIMVGWRKESY